MTEYELNNKIKNLEDNINKYETNQLDDNEEIGNNLNSSFNKHELAKKYEDKF